MSYLKYSFIAGLVCGLVLSCGIALHKFFTTSELFKIRVVEMQAGNNADLVQIEEKYKALIDKNIFAEIPKEVLFYNDPWISRLEIKRVLPDKAIVRIFEEVPLLAFQRDGACFILTASGKEIASSCETVLVSIHGQLEQAELREFIRLYNASPTIRSSRVHLKQGLFSMNTGEYTVRASYERGVFEENMQIFMEHVRRRYSNIESIDISVRGRVYVKGGRDG